MEVRLYSDGSSKGNPGPGGYGTILQYTDSSGKLYEREYSEGFADTTNNRMELMGVIRGLEELKKPCSVEVISDSKYVTDAFNKGWVENWIRKGWKGAGNAPVKNIDLWKRLIAAKEMHEVHFAWVNGHDGHPENERCDRLAVGAADKFIN